MASCGADEPIVCKVADEIGLGVHDGVLEVVDARRWQRKLLLPLQAVADLLVVVLEVGVGRVVHLPQIILDRVHVARSRWVVHGRPLGVYDDLHATVGHFG